MQRNNNIAGIVSAAPLFYPIMLFLPTSISDFSL